MFLIIQNLKSESSGLQLYALMDLITLVTGMINLLCLVPTFKRAYKEDEVAPDNFVKAYRGNRHIAPLILNLGTGCW